MFAKCLSVAQPFTHPKKLEVFGEHLLSKDDHSHWAPPYWIITKETFSFGRTEYNYKNGQLRVLGMFIKK